MDSHAMLIAEIVKLRSELAAAQKWVSDLQSGMYVNCVYCGHRYGPKDRVPCTMADALKQHIERCPKHPMSALKVELAAAREALALLDGFRGNPCEDKYWCIVCSKCGQKCERVEYTHGLAICEVCTWKLIETLPAQPSAPDEKGE